MRTGVLTLQQALTAEVATVLKHSLNLARRRGHAHVTPLHVAATLMSSSSASSDLLRRACLKSQPPAAASHHLHCRALELCFNVALNRLPTASPPSSGAPLLPPPASLSNSLVAALKRAQANQRRGCIELQQQQQPPPVKVEMEQLMLSILDDPSVSRVMKEAGFSSSCVKSLLEEETAALTQPSPFLLDSSSLHLAPPSTPLTPPCANDDLRAVMEAMTRKERKRSNVVVVGDSTSMREALVAELMGRMERGEVPNELKHASFVNLQFSPNHLQVMSKGEVESKVYNLRRTITSLASERGAAGVIIFAGDLRWAVDEEERTGEADDGGGVGSFFSLEHMVAEMGHLLSEVQSGINGGGKVWLLATASYQTYSKCLMKRPWLVAQWALQPVGVPCGWLALGLQVSSCLDNSRMPEIGNFFPFQLLEPRIQAPEEDEKLKCCEECAFNFEKEVLVFNFDRNHKELLVDLRRRWNKLCQSLHPSSHSHLYTPLFKSYYSTPLLSSWRPSSFFSVPSLKLNGGFSVAGADESLRESLNSPKMSSANQRVQTSFALSGTLFSDSATSKDQTRLLMADTAGLKQQLQEEIPWQSKNIPLIVDSIYECIHRDKKVARLLIRGSDHVAKRKLALVMAKSFFGSTDKFVHIRRDDSCLEILVDALRNDPKCVFFIENFDRMPGFVESFKEGIKMGSLEDAFGGEVSLADAIFILTTSNSTEFEVANCYSRSVLMLRLQDEDPPTCGVKRKPSELESDTQNRSKKSRTSEHAFDLNSQANEESEEDDDEEEEAVPSDLTHETDCMSLQPPLLESTVQLTLDAGS